MTPKGRIPPLVLMIGAFGAQRLIARRRVATGATRAGASALLAASAWLMGRSIHEFRRRRTTVNPVAIGAGSLVTSGPNRLTRNPMYLGMAGVLVAHALSLRSPVAVLPACLFTAVIDRVQIPAEEAALRSLFGDEYDAYVRATPRWLISRLPA
ncbi:methyltransferase family protein [Georgenia sp. Z1491]|uniref:methyltransferase family protein n=1 Tax=Georgenia sp. Z1491 TaxID=3416707 RepID=UPI003CF1CC2A